MLVTITLSSMTALIASSVRTHRFVEAILPALSTARSVITSIQDREQVVADGLFGTIGEHRWQLEVTRFLANEMAPERNNPWVPELVTITVRTKHTAKHFSVVRLQRKGDRP